MVPQISSSVPPALPLEFGQLRSRGTALTERGVSLMSKNKKILLAVAKGGMSQSDIAALLHVSKRDVSAAAKAVRELNLTFDAIAGMDADAVDDLFFPKEKRARGEGYLVPDMEALVSRKKKSRKLPVKLFWLEHVEAAASCGKSSYSYQTFCEMFADTAGKMGATRHFIHEPGAKAFIDWAGDTACITDRTTGAKAKVYVIVVSLPFSGRFWAEGFCDMRQQSWQDGQTHAFEEFGGVPRMLVPDNAATGTDRSALCVTLVNDDYERYAQHYGTAIFPARVRKPRDKSTAESTVNLVEQWIIGPANETTFYTLGEFNGFCSEKVSWLNSRPFSAKDGSRRELFDREEREHLLPLPRERYEICEWRSAKVAPDYHVTVDYMRYSVPHRLIGEQVDVKLSSAKVSLMADGEIVAEHGRLRGRKGQYSTMVEHMPDNHAALDSPWSPARFASWAGKIGPECASAIGRVLESRPIVEQSFTSCRNILGLSKTYSPALLERACERANSLGALVSYTSLKNSILAMKAADAERKCRGRAPGGGSDELVDRAKSAGRLRGAEAYRRGGEDRA